MIRILITEDSDVVATLLGSILDAEPDMQVVGRASNGREAVTMSHELRPDLITMDIRMPVMDGFEATRMIMSAHPTPIVVISSSVDAEELGITFRAIEEGALAVIEKPRGLRHPDFETIRRELVETIRAMAEVRLVRRRPPRPSARMFQREKLPERLAYQVAGIACSTGGPQVLASILGTLPMAFPLPLLVVQHISPGFIHGLVNWLRGHTLLEIRLAAQGMPLRPGCVYFAPDDYHLGVARANGGLVATLAQTDPVDRFRPSGSALFRSIAACCGKAAIGGLLTGMGSDGASGLAELHRAGGHTFVQDADSAVVYGMPGAALALDCVDQVVTLENISDHLNTLARQ